MFRLVNCEGEKSKKAIANEADHDLRALKRARVLLGNRAAPRRLSNTVSEGRVEESSSDDSDVEAQPKIKMPRIVPNGLEVGNGNDDEIFVVGEVCFQKIGNSDLNRLKICC
jgi:hypothetical protein